MLFVHFRLKQFLPKATGLTEHKLFSAGIVEVCYVGTVLQRQRKCWVHYNFIIIPEQMSSKQLKSIVEQNSTRTFFELIRKRVFLLYLSLIRYSFSQHKYSEQFSH